MRPPSQQQQDNTIHTVASPGRERSAKGNNDNNGALPAYVDDKKVSSSGSEGSIWPNFAVTVTNKEKEEDFLVFKGSKLPERPKKRVKAIPRTVNVGSDSKEGSFKIELLSRPSLPMMSSRMIPSICGPWIHKVVDLVSPNLHELLKSA